MLRDTAVAAVAAVVVAESLPRRAGSAFAVGERCGAGVLAEEPDERRGGREVQFFGDLEHREIGGLQAALRLDEERFVDPVLCRVSRRALDDGREVFGRRAELVGIEEDAALRFVVLQHQVEEAVGQLLLSGHVQRAAVRCGGFDQRNDDQDERKHQRRPYLDGVFVCRVVPPQQRVEGYEVLDLVVGGLQARAVPDALEPAEPEGDGQGVEKIGRHEEQFGFEVGCAAGDREEALGQAEEHLPGGDAVFPVVDPERDAAAGAQPDDDPVEKDRLVQPLPGVVGRHVHEGELFDLQLFSAYFLYIHRPEYLSLWGEYTKYCTFLSRKG